LKRCLKCGRAHFDKGVSVCLSCGTPLSSRKHYGYSKFKGGKTYHRNSRRLERSVILLVALSVIFGTLWANSTIPTHPISSVTLNPPPNSNIVSASGWLNNNPAFTPSGAPKIDYPPNYTFLLTTSLESLTQREPLQANLLLRLVVFQAHSSTPIRWPITATLAIGTLKGTSRICVTLCSEGVVVWLKTLG